MVTKAPAPARGVHRFHGWHQRGPCPSPMALCPREMQVPHPGHMLLGHASGMGMGTLSPTRPWQGEAAQPSGHVILLSLLSSTFPEMLFLHVCLCFPGFFLKKQKTGGKDLFRF